VRAKNQGPFSRTVEEYSSIEHLAFCCCGSICSWKEVRFSVFTACFDASGSKSKPWMVLAGFVAPAKAWDCFADLWNQRLNQDGIKYFHMKEFTACQGQFENWKGNELRRRALLSDLINLIKSHASRKFGHVIALEGVEHIKKAFTEKQQKAFILESYAIGGYSCAKHVDNWARMERIKTPIQFVFDDGDLDRQKLRDLFRQDWAEPIFRPSRDILKKGVPIPGFVPLQAADLLANELYQVCPQIPNVDTDKLRWPLQQLRTMPEEPTYMDWQGYDRLRRRLETMIPGLVEFDRKLKVKS
jgi:hypothetical protein